MSWRLARSLETLRTQVNAAWPTRSKTSDGTIGDEAHASRSSDHNPWVKEGAMGIVTAMDITHDPKSGCDSYKLAETLLKSRDPRIKYVISNGKIAAGTDGPQPWVWRKYSGANAHAHHVHISVKADKTHYDDTQNWTIGSGAAAATAAKNVVAPKSNYSADVERVQSALDKLGYHEVGDVDGLMGGRTRGAITAFMNDRHQLPETSITPALMAEIGRAQSERPPWTRPIAPDRAYATAKDIAPKVDSVKQNAWSRFLSKLLAIPSTVGAVGWGVVGNIPAAHDAAAPFISIVKENVSSIPGWVYLVGLAVIGGAIWYMNNKTEASTVADYQTGRIN